jgi:hypothetical protein
VGNGTEAVGTVMFNRKELLLKQAFAAELRWTEKPHGTKLPYIYKMEHCEGGVHFEHCVQW